MQEQPPWVPEAESEPREAQKPSQATNEKGADKGARRLGWAAAIGLTAFVFAVLVQLAHLRSPSARLEELVPRVGGQRVGAAFDPLRHDRDLEPAPWAQSRGPLRIADFFDHKVVFLNFWATWCEPCVRELPSMLRLAQSLRGTSFVMLAVSYDDSWEPIRGFFERHLQALPTNFVLARDPDTGSDPLRARYGTEKLPESYMLAGGRIVDRFINAHDWSANTKIEYFELLLASQR